jgi:hypothetical protein
VTYPLVSVPKTGEEEEERGLVEVYVDVMVSEDHVAGFEV